MTQKERALLTLEILVQNAGDSMSIDKTYILEKIRACRELIRPEVLLGQDEKEKWEELISKLKSQGKVI